MAFLILHMVSPLCHGISNAQWPADASEHVVKSAPAKPAAPTDSPENHCWFQTAHLFNKVLVPDGSVVSLAKFVFAALALVVLFVAVYSVRSLPRCYLPDRSPPSLSRLQIYRI